jgi:acid stress-induced BolA-like protein IbaG/YrbA
MPENGGDHVQKFLNASSDVYEITLKSDSLHFTLIVIVSFQTQSARVQNQNN